MKDSTACKALDPSLRRLISSAIGIEVHGEVSSPSFVCYGHQENGTYNRVGRMFKEHHQWYRVVRQASIVLTVP